jgi:hypothetical protein
VPPRILIGGSLYLAGHVLALNGTRRPESIVGASPHDQRG